MAGARRRFHLSGIRFQPFRHLRPRQLDEARALAGGSENGPVGRGTPRLETATGEAKEEHDRHDDRRNEKQHNGASGLLPLSNHSVMAARAYPTCPLGGTNCAYVRPANHA